MTIFNTILYAVIGFGILVFFHELGHFIMAKLFKVKVEVFALGWGPKLFGFKYKETTYQISVFPIGGFCKMKGDENFEDMPARIKETTFLNILEKSTDEQRTVLEQNFQLKLPATLDAQTYQALSSKEQAQSQLLAGTYHFNSIEEEYELTLSKDEEETDSKKRAALVRLLRKHCPQQLNYSLKENLDKKEKKTIYKILSRAIQIYKLRDPDSFYGVAPYKRLFVAFAGPFMNYILAVVFLFLLALGSHQETYLENRIVVIDQVLEQDSPAKKAGIKTGDYILQLENKKVKDYNDIYKGMIILGDQAEIDLIVKREGRVLTRKVNPIWDEESLKPILGVSFYQAPLIKADKNNLLLQYLKLEDQDLIVAINDDDQDMTTYKLDRYLQAYFQQSLKHSIDEKQILKVKRGGNLVDVEVDFNLLNRKMTQKEVYLSYYFPERTIQGKKFGAAIVKGFKDSTEIMQMTVAGLYYLIFKPKKNISNQIGGPLRIGALIGGITVEGFKKSVAEGVRNFLSGVALISLALAFFNLLPIPAVDGGHIILYAFEIISRRTISMRIIYLINMVGFMALIAIALLVLYLDIFNLIAQ